MSRHHAVPLKRSDTPSKETHPAYSEATLLALGETEEPIDLPLIYEAIRHIGTLKYEEHDRWLGWPLRGHLDSDLPDDIIGLIDPRETLAHEV